MDEKMRAALDKAKASASILLEKTGKAASNMVDVAGKKAGEVVEATKANYQIFDMKADIDVLYKEIGRQIYEKRMGAAITQQEIENKLVLIDEKREKIALLRQQLRESKDVETICPVCGRAYRPGDRFCSGCGEQL